MNTSVYYELLGRMIEAYDQAPNDDNPLMAIQMFAGIAADYIEGRRSAQRNLAIINDALPDITGGTGSVDTGDESDECDQVDPLDQIEAPEIVPVSDVEVERLKQNLNNQDEESNQTGGGGYDSKTKCDKRCGARYSIKPERTRVVGTDA